MQMKLQALSVRLSLIHIYCLTPDQKATCQCHSEASGSKAASEDLVNEITKKVIAALK